MPSKILGAPPQRSATAVVLAYARPYWRVWVLLAVLTFASTATTLAQPWVVKVLIDRVFDVPLRSSSQHVLIAAAALSAVVLAATGAVFERIQTRTWVRVGYTMVYDLAATIFSIIQRQSIQYHRRHTAGDILGRVALDSWCVYRIVETCILIPGRALLMTAVTVAVMLPIDAGLTLATLLAAPIMAGLNVTLGRRTRATSKTTREIETQLQAHVHQTLTGIDVVQAYAREEQEYQRFQQVAELAVRAQRRGALLTSLSDLVTGTIATLGTSIVLYVGARHVLTGTLRVGSLVVFLAYLTTMYEQMRAGLSAYLSLQGLGGQIDRVAEILQRQPDLPERPDAVLLGRVRGRVEFEDVSAGYSEGIPALAHLSLRIDAGETIAVVGPTGAGKSTLASLIPRFLDPWAGRVTVDGRDVRDVRLRDLRAQIAIVFQEPFLLPVSIGDNIRVGRPAATHEQLIAAAQAANAHDFIRRLPLGYDTIVGERGATLSGGERQRIAIARALLKDAPIVILDEPTSAVDTATEARLLDALRTLMHGRTTVVIAHRLSTIRDADRIAVLEHGRLREIGTHDELLTLGGLYAEMYGTGYAPAISMGARS